MKEILNKGLQKWNGMPTKYKEIFRFGVVGVIASAIHYVVYIIFNKFLAATIAYIIGYLVSWVCNFFLSNFFTFKTKPTVKNGAGFAFSHVINIGLHYVLFRFFLYVGVPENLAPIPTMCIATPVNFVLVRFFLKGKHTHK